MRPIGHRQGYGAVVEGRLGDLGVGERGGGRVYRNDSAPHVERLRENDWSVDASNSSAAIACARRGPRGFPSRSRARR
jgi:hypothetical protein